MTRGSLLLAGALLLASSQAAGHEACRSEVQVIAASRAKAPFPKALGRFRKALTSGRFSAFKGFRLLKVVRQPLVAGRAVSFVVAGPYLLELELLERLRVKNRESYRFRLMFKMKRHGKLRTLSRSVLRLTRGGTFFLAGPPWRQATLVLAITLK